MARPDPPLKPTVFCTSSNCSSNFSSLKHFIGKNGNSWRTITTHHNHELKYLNVLYCHNLPTSLLPQYKRTHTHRETTLSTRGLSTSGSSKDEGMHASTSLVTFSVTVRSLSRKWLKRTSWVWRSISLVMLALSFTEPKVNISGSGLTQMYLKNRPL